MDASDYPAGGWPEERLRFAIRYAILAPSSHNSQPWRFRIRGHVLELRADRRRRLPVVDPDDRELVISCGAALYTLRLALTFFAEAHTVVVRCEGGDEDLLATVALGGVPLPRAPGVPDLFAAIPRRHTNRRPYHPAPISPHLAARLVEAAAAEGATLAVVPEEKRAVVADLVAEGDRIQMTDRDFRRELAAWVHWNRSRADDGIRVGGFGRGGFGRGGFGRGDLASALGPLVIRTFDTGSGQGARDRELAVGSPLLAVLATPRDACDAWLAAGQALQHVLLAATAAGLSASFLNQPIEVAALRPLLAARLGLRDEPQLLLRFGVAPPAVPAVRRRADDVIDVG